MTNPADHISKIRADYRLATLDENDAGDEPIAFFKTWFQQAEAAGISEVNAMTLATADIWGMPSARTVLLKGIEADGFVFFTNYESDKGRQIAEEQSVALLFFWKELERQVRIEGQAVRIDEKESDAYFHSRPRGSQISASISPQSQIIDSRQALETAARSLEHQYEGQDIPRPKNWGGYKVIPEKIEFWQGRSNRLHDRIVFLREAEEDRGADQIPGYGPWEKFRIAP